jgi:cytochrome c peroxidase
MLVTGLALGSALSLSFNRDQPHPYRLEYPAYFGDHYSIPEDNPETAEGVALGRMLFYEKALSAGNKISCATCHQQQHAFSDGKRFSSGADGVSQPRNTMALVNVLWTRNFFWDGRTRGLEHQVDTPLTNIHEMGQSFEVSIKKLRARKYYARRFAAAFGNARITRERIEKALAQFERTLISCNSRYDRYLQGTYQPTASERNGIRLFYNSPDPARGIRGASCSHCHGGPKTYEELFMNNGLDSVYRDAGRATVTGRGYDTGRFRVVTLRNIALTAPYMHDGRFKTLEEVVDHYSDHMIESRYLSPFLRNNSNTLHGSGLDLTPQEKKDLIAFLHMLTDSSFITDKRFSNPFTHG